MLKVSRAVNDVQPRRGSPSLTDHTVNKSAPSEMVSTKCAQVDKQSDLKISEKELLYRQSNDNHLC